MIRYSYLAVFGFLCLLIIVPSFTDACGWAGDGDMDDSYDSDYLPWTDYPRVQTEMGNRYREGKEVQRNYKEAVYWYRRAAEQGFPSAQNNLAVMYEQGLGVSKDDSEAAKWFRMAAEGNNPKAQHALGVMYRDGRGVSSDPGEAAKWIREAAAQGHHGAFRDMGEMYWKGSGVTQNNVLACMWWKVGALHGDKESGRLLSTASEKMDSGSVIEAEKMAREWMQKNK